MNLFLRYHFLRFESELPKGFWDCQCCFSTSVLIGVNLVPFWLNRHSHCSKVSNARIDKLNNFL